MAVKTGLLKPLIASQRKQRIDFHAVLLYLVLCLLCGLLAAQAGRIDHLQIENQQLRQEAE